MGFIRKAWGSQSQDAAYFSEKHIFSGETETDIAHTGTAAKLPEDGVRVLSSSAHISLPNDGKRRAGGTYFRLGFFAHLHSWDTLNLALS